MITKSKLVLIAAIATVGIASPAFAKSYVPEVGAGNRGLYGYAMIPAGQFIPTVNEPAVTGGGSRGYNEGLLKNQW
jgi:hypothetical protein